MVPDECPGELPQLPPLVFVPAEEEDAAEPDFGAALEGEHCPDVVFGLRPRPHDGEGQVADPVAGIVDLHTE